MPAGRGNVHIIQSAMTMCIYLCLTSPLACAAGAAGALRLSCTVGMWNVSFERNSATSEGPAISNIGDIDNMGAISFNDNYFSYNVGEFLQYFDVEVSIRMLMNVRILSPEPHFVPGPCCTLPFLIHALVFVGLNSAHRRHCGMGKKCIVTSPSSLAHLPFWASLCPTWHTSLALPAYTTSVPSLQ